MPALDDEVIHAVLAGDADRYAELVDRYRGLALRLAFSLLGNYDDAKDVSQEAFVNAYRSLGRFHRGAKFSTWLYRIVVNECKDAIRQRTRKPMAVVAVGTADAGAEDDPTLFVDPQDPAAGPSEQLANRELARRLGTAIEQLPMNQRTAFLLHHVHGLPLDEVSGVMGCRVGTVKSHLFRATEQLRRHLSPWVEQEGI